MVGRFQVYNVLVAVSLAIVLGEDIDKVIRLLSQLKPVRGRMQLAGLRQNRAPIFVDYAHTPDALKNALVSLIILSVVPKLCISNFSVSLFPSFLRLITLSSSTISIM